jgi:hypothetical protein
MVVPVRPVALVLQEVQALLVVPVAVVQEQALLVLPVAMVLRVLLVLQEGQEEQAV